MKADRHDLTPAKFSALATGHGGADAVRALRRAQLSKYLLLTKFIVEQWTGDLAVRDGAVAALSTAQARMPDAVADLFSDPLVGAWTAWTVRAIRDPARSDTPLAVDCGHLSAIAAVAAHRSGVDADLTLYARDGRVALPTMGDVVRPLPDFVPVVVTVRDGDLEIAGQALSADPATSAEDWRPHRSLRAQVGQQDLAVRLDDLDPYRGGHHAPPLERLPDSEVDRWQHLFAEAIGILCDHAPSRVEELAAGLRTLVPLEQLDPSSARSATIRDSYGAFGLTLPASAVDFAATMVHEFQHSKLNALLDLDPLYDGSDGTRHYAPWRIDPRPVGGLFQGIYAFLGIAELWLSLRERAGLENRATREFATMRGQVERALSSLEQSPALTPAGERFAAGIRATQDKLMAEPLPREVARQTAEALDADYRAWRERNGVAA